MWPFSFALRTLTCRYAALLRRSAVHLPALRLQPPSIPLRGVVQALWCVDVRPGQKAPDWSFMHPDGGAGLVFNVGQPLSISHRAATADGPPGVCWEGVSEVSGRFWPREGQRAFGVRFWPAGAVALWGERTPLSEVGQLLAGAGRPPAVASALGDLAARLVDMTPEAGLACLDQWLRRYLRPPPSSPVVAAALRALPAAGSVAEVVAGAAVARRTLERHFREQVGLSPKGYMRLCRLAQARDLLKARALQGTPMPQVDIALRLGYCDEAHFIRDFQRVIGMTPGHYGRRYRQG
ncbi:helix-turn-helix domain-containing protein [Isoalcanivorax indicus]|uniref:helix-turn-helix domain-containing protein n=1 Tax=Isoalcanivorax indicus TaxID=2202653 RepID=UPI00319D8C54